MKDTNFMTFIEITANVDGFAQAGHWNCVSPAVKPFGLMMFQDKQMFDALLSAHY
jgi:hypothetical protein